MAWGRAISAVRGPKPVRTALLCGLALGAASPALGQSAKDNALEEAEDAFGGSIGLENIGIYTATNVRGFDPQKAGNARIEGVYFDQLSTVGSRARDITSIRVGFAALDTFGPSPTGIVAYRLHESGDEASATLGVAATAYGETIESIIVRLPLVKERFSIAAGIAYAGQEFADGSRSDNYGYGFLPRLRLGGVEIKGVLSGYVVEPDRVRPITALAGPFLPALPGAGEYLGQRWAEGRNLKFTNGMTVRADIVDGLRFRGGVFRSRWDHDRKFTEVYRVLDEQGRAQHFLLADPKQKNYANSWEGLLSYSFGSGGITHSLVAGARGRFRHIESGGSHFIDFGEVVYGDRDARDRPKFQFGPVNLGKLRQVGYTAGYIARWKGVGQINLGVNRTDYDASFTNRLGTTRSRANPWLYNASLLIKPAGWLSIYGGIVTGLEDNGSAPENALNRGEQLPAVRTRQIDGGVQLKLGKTTLVASLFEIEKPYYSFDSANTYVRLGDVRHRGAEMSLTGHLTRRFHVVAGAVLTDPVVSGGGIALGLVGRRPVGTPRLHAKMDVAYRTDMLGGLSLTAAMLHDSKRPASAQNHAELGGRQLFLPARTTIDIGARHNIAIGKVPTSLRFVVENVFDKKSWDTVASNSLQPGERRRWSLYLISDF